MMSIQMNWPPYHYHGPAIIGMNSLSMNDSERPQLKLSPVFFSLMLGHTNVLDHDWALYKTNWSGSIWHGMILAGFVTAAEGSKEYFEVHFVASILMGQPHVLLFSM